MPDEVHIDIDVSSHAYDAGVTVDDEEKDLGDPEEDVVREESGKISK